MSRHRPLSWTLLLASIALASTACVLPVNDARSGEHIPRAATPGQFQETPVSIVVRARHSEDLALLRVWAHDAGYVVTRSAPELPALELRVPNNTSIARAIVLFAHAPGALYAEPAYPMATADVPADPLYERESQYLDAVSAPAAWDIETGNPDVIVAVLDTGVDRTHPDLDGRIWTNAAEVAGNAFDDDGNGCSDDAHGCAFVHFPDPGCEEAVNGAIEDDVGHGTFVSGIIAANGGNGMGMVGVARGVTIMPVKVLDCNGSGNSLDLAQGILYAASNGARVINISLGGEADSLIVREAVRIAYIEYGAVLVAASGNTGAEGVSYPARYDEVIAVGAASADDPGERATFSSTGPEVDVVAIGEGIIGTVPADACKTFLPCIGGDDPYAIASGTSFTAPQVSGLAALILSHRPGLTADGVVTAIKATATVLPPGDRPTWSGAGRIDMLGALRPRFRLGVPGAASNP